MQRLRRYWRDEDAETDCRIKHSQTRGQESRYGNPPLERIHGRTREKKENPYRENDRLFSHSLRGGRKR